MKLKFERMTINVKNLEEAHEYGIHRILTDPLPFMKSLTKGR
ncbi:hypothetical protein ACFLXF_04985 [Chloroflexota bacterium]